MTTWQATKSLELSDALTLVAAILERQGDGAAKSVHEMRAAAHPGNRTVTAAVDEAAFPRITAALRAVAADGPHPLAEQLEGIATGFDQRTAMRRANGGR
jgi:hypothetical protein